MKYSSRARSVSPGQRNTTQEPTTRDNHLREEDSGQVCRAVFTSLTQLAQLKHSKMLSFIKTSCSRAFFFL